MSRWLLALAAAVLAVAPLTADDSTLKVKVGDAFPDEALEATQIDKVKKDAKTLSVKDLKGKIVVVFFYPKANTPGCTTESCGFRDLANEFPKDVVLLGASSDDTKDNGKFTTDKMLPYPLLCDTDMKLIKSLGIYNPDNKRTKRVTFILDRDGKIAKIYDKDHVQKVGVKDHPKEVLTDVKELEAKK